jgi:hypothetical protein
MKETVQADGHKHAGIRSPFMSRLEDYRRRATECLAFAKIARDEEERTQMLIMANTLNRLAVEREKKAVKARSKEP